MSDLEWNALWSLGLACADVQQEWETVQRHANGVLLKADMAQELAGDEPLGHFHAAAVDDVARLAVRHEDRVGALAWRYASAAFVLGVTVMDRVLRGAAPLPREAILRLAQEPSFGRLKEAAGEPYAGLVAFRVAGDGSGFEAKQRKQVLELLDWAGHGLSHRLPAADVDGALLTVASEEGTDPLWMGAVTPMLDAAEAVLHWIAGLRHTVGAP